MVCFFSCSYASLALISAGTSTQIPPGRLICETHSQLCSVLAKFVPVAAITELCQPSLPFPLVDHYYVLIPDKGGEHLSLAVSRDVEVPV